MSASAIRKRLTIAEYLALEEDSITKHEFYQGEIIARAGATLRHNEICSNIIYFLRDRLSGQRCRPYGSDLRISITKVGLYTYSDTVVLCPPVKRDENDRHAVTNPKVIFEVLSKSTENYDRGQKWEFYQQLDSLREYLLVSQEEAKVTRYFRSEGGAWNYLLVSGLDQILQMEALDCQLALAEIYDNVTFGPEESV